VNVPQAGILGVVAGIVLAGCGTGVSNSQQTRAGSAVQSFLEDCSRGAWVSASRIVTETTRDAWLREGNPALRCAESLGVDPAVFSTLTDADQQRMEADFGHAVVKNIVIRGDQATAEVDLAGIPGEVDLENEGENVYSISTQPREP
jgi:hypothetical protein